jgi:3-hydroxyacyl-[acyl-carrier-protein] dehydratase
MKYILIDRLLALEPGVCGEAVKRFAPEDELFEDHFPGNPLVPGALLLEAMAQTAGWLTVATTGFKKATQLVMVRNAKFRRPVRPGAEITLRARIVSSNQHAFALDVEAAVDEGIAAHASLILHTTDLPLDSVDGDVFRNWARNTFHAIGGDSLIGEAAE